MKHEIELQAHSIVAVGEAFFQHLHDLVAATFSKLVRTPITALGINYS